MTIKHWLIYNRLFKKYPNFSIVVHEFEPGGHDGKKVVPNQYGLFWQIEPTSNRGYVRGTYFLSSEKNLKLVFQEAWTILRRW